MLVAFLIVFVAVLIVLVAVLIVFVFVVIVISLVLPFVLMTMIAAAIIGIAFVPVNQEAMDAEIGPLHPLRLEASFTGFLLDAAWSQAFIIILYYNKTGRNHPNPNSL